MNSHYENNLQHILDEMTRIDLLLQFQIKRFRSRGRIADVPDQFSGLYISEQEIDQLTTALHNQTDNIKNTGFNRLREAIDDKTQKIRNKVNASLEQGIQLNLILLAQLYNLTQQECEILLICLAQVIDTKYERLFAYLQNDITQKQPGVDLVLDLICHSIDEKIAAHKYFSPDASLFKNGLLEFIESNNAPLLSKHLKIDDRIAGYILGNGIIDGDVNAVAQFYYSRQSISSLILNKQLKHRLSTFVEWYLQSQEEPQNIIFNFCGADDWSKKETAAALCRELNVPLLIVDLESLVHYDTPFVKMMELVCRESLLLPCALYFDKSDAVFNLREDSTNLREKFTGVLNFNSWFTFLCCRQSISIQEQFIQQRFIDVEFGVPGYRERQQSWTHYLKNQSLFVTEIDTDALAGKYNLTTGQIQAAIATARNRAYWRNPQDCQITMADLYDGCRTHSNQKLNVLSQRISPKYVWGDIVLPRDQMEQLREITNYMKFKHKVYDDWGFDRKLSLGKGLNVLFSGPSGTGKTMAAEIMANELKLDLYKIDLSTVVSKYIGETEKNLAKIFREAETSNAILFFDEADALFGKRSEVKDAHDRYANIEIGYLLQKMDEYTGIVILATNMKKNMDDAFIRRMHFIVEFPFPEEQYRLNIWQNIFPKETPLSNEIDLTFLARKFKISGGNIKNVALAAAFYAADNGQAVDMKHLIRATKREFQKMGKLCGRAEFEKYYDLLEK